MSWVVWAIVIAVGVVLVVVLASSMRSSSSSGSSWFGGDAAGSSSASSIIDSISRGIGTVGDGFARWTGGGGGTVQQPNVPDVGTEAAAAAAGS